MEGSEADSAFRRNTSVMHVRQCSDREIRIPFHVGENRSRTWVVTRTPQGLRLKHDHRHEDGTEDRVTQYGGDTRMTADAPRLEPPYDRRHQLPIGAAIADEDVVFVAGYY